MPTAEIFSQGDEVITGQTVDTNAAWLSERLFELGFSIRRHTVVGDRLDEMVSLLREISERSDFCICTGGLGPTQDDLTAEAVSTAFDRKLILDEDALSQINQYFSRVGREMPEVNIKQAMIPERATRLDNLWGTAPGFSLKADRCWFVFLPGVPYEMRNLFSECLRLQLLERFQLKPWRLVTLRVVGIGESAIQQKLENIRLPDQATLSFRTANHENQIKLLFPFDLNISEVHTEVDRVADAIGKNVFGIDGLEKNEGPLIDVISKLMLNSRYSLAVAETVSGGQIACRCAHHPWFTEGVVVQDVSRLLAKFGKDKRLNPDDADYASVVKNLARSVVDDAPSKIALVQCWNEDWQAYHDKSAVVQFHTGLATPAGVFYHTGKLSGPAPRKQTVAATSALDTLRYYLQGYLG